jgi:hypothetical protein
MRQRGTTQGCHSRVEKRGCLSRNLG